MNAARDRLAMIGLSAKGAIQLQPRATPWETGNTPASPVRAAQSQPSVEPPFQGFAGRITLSQGVALGWS
jgi:hypothetical protein